jgi:hypothetical protein
MPSASEFMVGSAPQGASYAAPLVGQQIGQQIGNLPQDYYEGQKRQRELAVMNAFPNGIPPGTTAQDIMGTLAKAGGGQYVLPMLQYMFQQQADAPLNSFLSGTNFGGNGGARAPVPSYPSPARNTPTAIGSASLVTRPQGVPQQGSQPGPMQEASPQAPMSSTGMDNNGVETIRTMLASMGGAKDMGSAIKSVGATLGLDTDTPLTPSQSARVGAYVRANADALGIPSATQKTAQAQQPVQGNVPVQEAQPVQEDDQTLGDLIPKTWIDSGHTAAEYRDVLSALAARPSITEGARAAAIQRLKAIDEAFGAGLKLKQETAEQNKRLTGEEKNARNPDVATFEMTKEWNKQDVERYSKQAASIDAQADAADHMRPQFQLAKGLFKDPRFYSGVGEGTNLFYKRAVAAFGGDPNAALPQETFRKIMAANVLEQIANLKAETAASGGTTRIFQAQIDLMRKAAQNPDNSIAANRLLTEIGTRLSDRATQIADMKAAYKNGHIDSQFNTQLRRWSQKHDIFTPDEMKHLDEIAPREFDSLKDAYNAKLKPGTPIKINGELTWTK